MARAEVMHLLVKWSPARERDTLAKHHKVAAEQGTTWWGCESSAESRRVAAWRVDVLRRQLREPGATEVYLYRLGDGPDQAEVHRARLVDVAEDEVGIDRARRPEGYEESTCFLFLELAEFEEVEAQVIEGLQLYDAPHGRSVDRGSLGNQTSPLYVVRSGPP